MGRRGISYEKKLEAVEKYQRGEGGQSSIARQYGVDRTSFKQWLAIYEAMGPSGLAAVKTNNRYSTELKIAAVEAYLRGEEGLVEICKKYASAVRRNS